MYYLFLLMLNSKKLISLSLASALVLSLPLNSLAIGVNDASQYVTSSDYNAKIAEFETRIADLEANQNNTTDVNTALQNYFNDDATSPIVAGDYITITNSNGKKILSATSKPTVVTASTNDLVVTKSETDTSVTYGLKLNTNTYRANIPNTATSKTIITYILGAIPENITQATVYGTVTWDNARITGSAPLFSGATGSVGGFYYAEVNGVGIRCSLYDSAGLYAVGVTFNENFKSITDIDFHGTRVTNPAAGNSVTTNTTFTVDTRWTLDHCNAYKKTVGALTIYFLDLLVKPKAVFTITNSSLLGDLSLSAGHLNLPAVICANGVQKSATCVWDNKSIVVIANETVTPAKGDYVYLAASVVL